MWGRESWATRVLVASHPTSIGFTHSIGAATSPARGERVRQWPRCQPLAVAASPGWRCSL